MNENHENNTNETIEEPIGESIEESIDAHEPLTRRVAKFSAMIYLALALTVVIVATVGIFSISYDYETDLPEVSLPDVSFEHEVSVPQSVITPPVVSDTPAGNEQSDVDADVSEPEVRVMFYRPVEGAILKNHSMDALVFSETMNDYRVHSGIDLAAEAGTEVVAYTDGVIASVTNDYFNGTTVEITHEQGVTSYYMNLSDELAESIAVGTEVKAGQVIGHVGNTSRIEAKDPSHLHFELHVNGEPIDPLTEMP